MEDPLPPPTKKMNNPPCPPGRRQERQQNVENRLTGIYGDHLKTKKKWNDTICLSKPTRIRAAIRE